MTDARPPSRPYDADKWARIWGLVGAALLLIGTQLPFLYRHLWHVEVSRFSSLGYGSAFAIPLIAAVVASYATLRLRVAGRGMTLLACGLLQTLGPMVARLSAESHHADGHTAGDELLGAAVLGLVVLSGIAIGAGNHVRRTWHDSRAAGRLTGGGGTTLLLTILVVAALSIAAGATPQVIIGDWGWYGTFHAALLALLLTYAILGAVELWSRSPAPRRWRLLALVASAMPILVAADDWAASEYVNRVFDVPVDSPLRTVIFAETLHTGVLRAGGWILCAVGLAAWLEARLAQRGTPSNEDHALARVFE